MLARFFADVKCDRAQAVKASLLSNSALACSVHPLNGQTTLQVAVQSAGESMIRALRRHGARWTDTDPQGNNAVHYVAQVARVDLCRYRKSADWVMALHAPNLAGDTPLHTTMALPDIPEVTEIIQAFVAVGADIKRPNSEGKSSLDLAEDRPELYQLMQDTANACRAKPSQLATPDSASNMSGGMSQLAGGPSLLGGGPSFLGGQSSFIGGPGVHAYNNFAPRPSPFSNDPRDKMSPKRAGSGLGGGDSRMGDAGGSPVAKGGVAFGRAARPRSTSTPVNAHRSPPPPHMGVGGARQSFGTQDGRTAPSLSPQPRSRTPVSRYSPPTNLRAIRTSSAAEASQAPQNATEEAMAAAASGAQRARRATASGAARTGRREGPKTTGVLDHTSLRLEARGGARSPQAGSPGPRTAVSTRSSAAQSHQDELTSPAPAPKVDHTPLERKVAEVQHALRSAKASLSEVKATREADKQQMSDLSKSIVLVGERLDSIDSAVRTVASATAEAAEAAATGRKESVGDMRELKGHVESLWKDVAQVKEWRKEAERQLGSLQQQVQRASAAAEDARATAEAATATAADASTVAAAAADTADAAVAAAEDTAWANGRAEGAAAEAVEIEEQAAAAAAERDGQATEAATAEAAARAANAAEAVAAVTAELEALRAVVADVQALRGSGFDTMKEDIQELQVFHSAARERFVDLDDAVERLDERVSAAEGERAHSHSIPMHTGGVGVPEEVAERLDEVWRKVGVLEMQVAGVSKGHCADGEGGQAGSRTSASPPRTPEACMFSDDVSLDITSDIAPPATLTTTAAHREVTASKAGIYTNIYSGPTAALEYSMLSERVDMTKVAVDTANKAVKELRADVDSLKAGRKHHGSSPFSDGGLGAFGRAISGEEERETAFNDMRDMHRRDEAARHEADAAVGDLEDRMERMEHATELMQHSVAQHEEKICRLMYSPGQARLTDAGSAGLRNTVEQLETRLMQVEVQYAGRLQAQKAKVDQQGALITALMERVAALESRSP